MTASTNATPSHEEVEDLALRLEIDYREHRYQNCQRAASMLRRLTPSATSCSHDWSEPPGFSTRKCIRCGLIETKSATRSIKNAEAAIDLFLEYRDRHGYNEDAAKAAALNEFAEAESAEVQAADRYNPNAAPQAGAGSGTPANSVGPDEPAVAAPSTNVRPK